MTDGLRGELRRWGFSNAEVDVYFALLDLGEGSASEVGKRADVSARHVYRVCERLEERGLVDVDEHVQPTRVRARSPTDVEGVIDRSAETMVEAIQSRFTRSAEEPTAIEVLKRQPTVLARARSLVADAERWMILVAPPDVVETVEDELAAATARGVVVFLVTTVEALETDRPLGELATVVRSREGPKGFQEVGLGVDDDRSLMVSLSARMGDEHRYSPAIYVDDETLGRRNIDALFGIEWRIAREYLIPDPAPLPFESSFFREVVLQAARHEREGTALRATVTGRALAGDAEDAAATDDHRGRRETIAGAVVGVRQDFLEPYRQSFLGERTLELETEDGRVTVGGPLATLEDYAAETVTLSSEE